MSKIILADRDQLKCNFCTNWFSVSSLFGKLQRYCLNACDKCIANFRYSLVDPVTYEVYEVLLVKTGYSITSIHGQLQSKFEAVVQAHRNCKNLTTRTESDLRKYNEEVGDIQVQIRKAVQQEKQEIANQFRQKIDKLHKQWENKFIDIDTPSVNISKIYEHFVEDISVSKFDFEDQQNQVMWSLAGEAFMKIMNEYEQSKKANRQNRDPNRQESSNFGNLKNRAIGNPMKESVFLNVNANSTKNSNIFDVTICKSIQKSNSKDNLLKSRLKKVPSINFLGSRKQSRQRDNSKQIINQKLKEKSIHNTYMQKSVLKQESQMIKQFSTKNMIQAIAEIKIQTKIDTNVLQLVGKSVANINFECYLKSLNFQNTISILRLIKVHLVDADFDALLHFMAQKPQITTLIVTNNNLSQSSIQALVNFKRRHPHSCLTNVYMGNNFIKPSKSSHHRNELKMLGIEVTL